MSYDSNGQDQQVTVSFGYLVPKAQFKVYGEFGRRDHADDCRDFLLSPEHARVYLLGFQKLLALPKNGEFIQVRGEVTHQQESVNRYIGYLGLGSNQTWHAHGLARGFVNYGRALGVGADVGSNVQTLGIARVSGLNKRGVQLERLSNHQDFFYRAFGQDPEKNPWIDFSLGLRWDQRWDRLIFGGKAQFIQARSYQWQSKPNSSSDFPDGKNYFSFQSRST